MNRYIDHEKGDNKRAYTYSRRPFKFLYWEIYESPEDAIHREKQIKKWNRAKKNALIYGNFGKLKKLAKRRK
jgi:putative endonuclease